MELHIRNQVFLYSHLWLGCFPLNILFPWFVCVNTRTCSWYIFTPKIPGRICPLFVETWVISSFVLLLPNILWRTFCRVDACRLSFTWAPKYSLHTPQPCLFMHFPSLVLSIASAQLSSLMTSSFKLQLKISLLSPAPVWTLTSQFKLPKH